MRQVEILQGICLDVYGVSLADIAIKEFERLNSILIAISWLEDTQLWKDINWCDGGCNCECDWCNNQTKSTSDDLKWAEDTIHKLEVEPLFCSQYCLDFYLQNCNRRDFTVSCPNCRKEHDNSVKLVECCDKCNRVLKNGEDCNCKLITCGNCNTKFDLNRNEYVCPACGYEELPF